MVRVTGRGLASTVTGSARREVRIPFVVITLRDTGLFVVRRAAGFDVSLARGFVEEERGVCVVLFFLFLIIYDSFFTW